MCCEEKLNLWLFFMKLSSDALSEECGGLQASAHASQLLTDPANEYQALEKLSR
jgi:hypothetical protein